MRSFGNSDEVLTIYGDTVTLSADNSNELLLTVPKEANPVFEVGIKVEGTGKLYLDWLTWEGTPEVTFTRPEHEGSAKDAPTMWRKSWITAVDSLTGWQESFRLVQNEGVGLIMQGTRDWKDYEVTADVTPHLAKRAGIAARVQGLGRDYALELKYDNKVHLVDCLLYPSPSPRDRQNTSMPW